MFTLVSKENHTPALNTGTKREHCPPYSRGQGTLDAKSLRHVMRGQIAAPLHARQVAATRHASPSCCNTSRCDKLLGYTSRCDKLLLHVTQRQVAATRHVATSRCNKLSTNWPIFGAATEICGRNYQSPSVSWPSRCFSSPRCING